MNSLDTTLENYAKDLRALVNIAPKQFDIARIATMITSIPERKWNAAQAVVNATLEKKGADRKVKTTRATEMLSITDDMDLKNVADRTAWVDKRPEVMQAEVDAIQAEADLLAAKLAYECLDDLFTAGKKIMDYLVEQERATKQYNRYVDEGKRTR